MAAPSRPTLVVITGHDPESNAVLAGSISEKLDTQRQRLLQKFARKADAADVVYANILPAEDAEAQIKKSFDDHKFAVVSAAPGDDRWSGLLARLAVSHNPVSTLLVNDRDPAAARAMEGDFLTLGILVPHEREDLKLSAAMAIIRQARMSNTEPPISRFDENGNEEKFWDFPGSEPGPQP